MEKKSRWVWVVWKEYFFLQSTYHKQTDQPVSAAWNWHDEMLVFLAEKQQRGVVHFAKKQAAEEFLEEFQQKKRCGPYHLSHGEYAAPSYFVKKISRNTLQKWNNLNKYGYFD